MQTFVCQSVVQIVKYVKITLLTGGKKFNVLNEINNNENVTEILPIADKPLQLTKKYSN